MELNKYDQRWCALQVIPRHEVIVSTILRIKGYEEFLPLYRSQRQWSDRKKEIELPLFTGYVFCRIDSTIPWTIVTTPGVIRIVGTRTEVALIDAGEIEAIRRVVKAGIKCEPCEYARIGDRVRIEKGPLAGVEGIVTGYKNKQRLTFSISPIESAISVEVDGWDMSLVSAAPIPSTGHGQSPRNLPC
ncbi:MAG TPA: UpxY family transcription antiterminator [Candidatus Angelobacter sp.]